MAEIKIGGKTRFENFQLALRARWLFYHFISNSGSWNNCYVAGKISIFENTARKGLPKVRWWSKNTRNILGAESLPRGSEVRITFKKFKYVS